MAQRRLHEWLAGEERVSATTIQTVGVKGYDGFTLGLVAGVASPAIFLVRPNGPVVLACPTPGAGGSPVFDTRPER